MRQRRGFTLIEMMISLALLAIVLQIGYVMLSDTLDGEESLRRRMDAEQTADGLRDLLAGDFRNVLLPEPTSAGEKEAKAVGRLEAARGPSGLTALSFWVLAEPEGYPGAGRIDPVEVRYAVETDRNTRTGRLVRAGRQEEVLAAGVRAFDLEAFDGRQWSPWTPPSGGQAVRLPAALRLRLRFEDGRTAERTILLERFCGQASAP